MTQLQLVRLSQLSNDDLYERGGDAVYDPTGDTAYGSSGEKIGTVQDALVDPDTGRVRQFIVDVGGWFSSKSVLVPVGHARMDDDAVYFDDLTKGQVGQMTPYDESQGYTDEAQAADERVLRGVAPDAALDDADRAAYQQKAYSAPDKLQLLEERLVVAKDRIKAGSVQIGKRVETRQEQVNVALQREEVVIERRAVTDAQPVAGAVLGADSQTLNIDLEAERANVEKQAYVTEEVEIGKRTVTDNQTVSETVGREVLDVTKTGDVNLEDADKGRA